MEFTIAKKRIIKESELFKPVKTLLELNEWEVYSEVQQTYGGFSRADIVATKGELLIVIELKNTLSLSVMEQAYDWIGAADFVFVAVPKARRGSRSEFSSRILHDYGIGILNIDIPMFERWDRKPKFEDTEQIRQLRNSNDFYGSQDMGISFKVGRRHTITRKNVFKNLFEEHQQWLDGGSSSSAGKYVTPYALLMKDVYDFLRKQSDTGVNDGWVSVNEIWDYLKENSKPIVVNHYKNPKQSIGSALRKYEVSDVENLRLKNKNYYKIIQESDKYIFGEHV